MSTHILINCEQCRHELRIRPDYLGRRVACNFCRHRFVALEPEGTGLAPTSSLGTVETIDHTALQEDAKRARDALRRLKSEYDTLALKGLKADDRRKALQRRVEDLESALSGSELQLRKAQDVIAALQGSLAEVERLHLEIDGLQARLSRAVEFEAEVQSLKGQLQRRQVEFDEAEARIAALQLQIEQQSLGQTCTDQERQTALAEAQTLTSELKSTRAERDELVDLLRQTRHEFGSAHEEAAATERAHLEEIRRLGVELDATRRDLEQSNSRHVDAMNSLRQESQEEQAAHEAAAQSIQALRSELDTSYSTIAVLRVELDRLASNHQALETNARLAGERNRAEITRLTNELAKAVHRNKSEAVPVATLYQRIDTQSLPQTELPPRPRLSPNDDPARFRLALQDWVSQAQRRQDQSTVDLANVERELVSAREQLLLIHRDVALGQWDKDTARAPYPFEEP